MDQLDYLKQQFLKNANFTLIQRKDHDAFQSTELFFEVLPKRLKVIQNAPTEEAFHEEWLALRKDVLNRYSEARKLRQPISGAFYDYYFNANLSDITWVNSQVALFKKKSRFNLFEKLGLSKSLRDIFKSENILENPAIIIKAQEILNTYGFKSINLTEATNSKEALDFLEKLEINLKDVAQKLGVKPEVLSLNGTLNISYTTEFNPSYCSHAKNITLLMDITPNVILHEWTHALDNYVAQKALSDVGEFSFVSDHETLNMQYDDSQHEAFKIIKQLTRSLMNEKPQDVESYLEDQAYLGACKFFSLIMGAQWYGLTQQDRNKLFTPEILMSINNYLVSSTTLGINLEYSDGFVDLTYYMVQTGLITETEMIHNLKANKKEIEQDVMPYYEKLNRNMIGEPSKYYKSSKLAAWYTFTDRAQKSLSEKINGWFKQDIFKINDANITNKDYFVQPTEMLARYFEAQVYNYQAKLTNLLIMTKIYKTKKDENFEMLKDQLITHALGANMLLPKVKLANTQEQKSHIKKIREKSKNLISEKTFKLS